MLFPQLLCRNNTAAEVCELHKLMLNSLEPLTPLAVGDLITCSIPAVTPKLLIQLLNVSDLHSETPDLVPKDPEMIHMLRIAYPDISRHDCTKRVVVQFEIHRDLSRERPVGNCVHAEMQSSNRKARRRYTNAWNL